MKRKLPLLLAVVMLVTLLCTPVAHAAAAFVPSPGGETEINEVDVPLVEIPEVVIQVNATVNAGTTTAVVPEDELLAAVAVVNAGDAVRITIISTGGKDAVKEEVVLPGSAIQAVVQSGAELRIVTAAGGAIIPNNALGYFAEAAGDGDIILVIEKIEEQDVETGVTLLKGQGVDAARIKDGSVSKVYVICNGVVFYNWVGDSIALSLPVGAGDFEEDSVYTVYQLDENGANVRTLEGLCTMEDGELRVVVSVDSRLGYFVVLPEAVAQNVAAVDPSIVTSPLASKAAVESDTGLLASVQHWLDSVASQFMKLFGL